MKKLLLHTSVTSVLPAAEATPVRRVWHGFCFVASGCQPAIYAVLTVTDRHGSPSLNRSTLWFGAHCAAMVPYFIMFPLRLRLVSCYQHHRSEGYVVCARCNVSNVCARVRLEGDWLANIFLSAGRASVTNLAQRNPHIATGLFGSRERQRRAFLQATTSLTIHVSHLHLPSMILSNASTPRPPKAQTISLHFQLALCQVLLSVLEHAA